MEPESTAARVALWRALHIQLDSPPHVLNDEIGYRLVAPSEGWRERPDMHPQGTSTFRASIVARSRFIEDLLIEKLSEGIAQYVILGAGVDTFAQRKPEIASRLNVFEVDQPAAQEWKKHRLNELGYGTPEWLNFVPVDFESGDDWWQRLVDAGFDVKKTALVASTGVSMYLTRESIESTLRQVARLATGSVFVMSFLLPIEMADAEVRPGLERAVQGARASGTPFISFFQPQEIMDLARECGFSKVEHVSAEELGNRYFAGRPDGLRPPRNTEELLVATT
jgi:methyltransferase (TIGR00027 family)